MPENTDNIDDSHDTETRNTYSVELVELANGNLIMVTSERGTGDDGIATYQIDNNINSTTFGHVIGTMYDVNLDEDLNAKIDQIGTNTGGREVGYGEIADMASVTLANGKSFVYSADFEMDGIGIAEVLGDGSLVKNAPVQSFDRLDAVKELSIVEVDGNAYLISMSGGHSDRLTTWAIDANTGGLTEVDSAKDGSDAGENFLNNSGHFGSATMMEAFNAGGTTFIVTGGDDDGIALWTMDANGTLSLQDAREDDRAGAGDTDTQGGDLGRDLIAPRHTGLHDLGDAAFFNGPNGETYVVVGGNDDKLNTFRIDTDGSGGFQLTLVGQSEHIVHDISSLQIIPAAGNGVAQLVVGGEQQGLEFYEVNVNSDGTVGYALNATVRDQGEPGAELLDSEDIDYVNGILVSASDNDSGVALIDTKTGAQSPDGVVDGEDTGENMGAGYDDSNAPTDGGGDLIGTGDDDVIDGNGGDDTIDGRSR